MVASILAVFFGVLPMKAQAPTAAPTLVPATEASQGVFVAARRTPGHVTTSSPEVFHKAVDAMMEWLKSKNVNVVEDPVRGMIRTADAISVNSLANVARDAGATHLLVITVDRPVTKWIKVTLQCYDLSGQLLWAEEASEGGGLNAKNCIPKTMEKLKKKLQPRLGQPGLPLKATAPTQP